jgi:Tat protein translocase TatB subunit
MPQLSPIEILVVATIALIVFGPEKLPQIARTIGRGASELRRMATEVKDEFQAGLDLDEDDEPPKKPSRRPHPNERTTPSKPSQAALEPTGEEALEHPGEQAPNESGATAASAVSPGPDKAEDTDDAPGRSSSDT